MEPITPIHYHLIIEPDLTAFTFSGRAVITLHADAPVSRVTLHAIDLAVTRCEAETETGRADAKVSVDTEAERLVIDLPVTEAVAGDITLTVDYTGEINDRMAGFYRSRYPRDGGEGYIAITQFQESDARRAFPCIDHPVAKATFEVEMIIDRELVAVSNTSVARTAEAEAGKLRVAFKRTPKMSTYLLFFGVGPFETIHDPVDSRVRLLALAGRTEYGDFGLAFGREALQYCEAYYGIDYPLPKLDLIAVPDFAFGAMENWGAITFRENLLLHYPGFTSRAGAERICEVIAHEIAHQWFGNLVTPSDWRYLWLNESFATYFGFGVVANRHPDWGVWESFLLSQTDRALTRDALLETFAIEIPGGEHVVINTATAPIIYNKGGAILRQIEGDIGADAFQAGLRRYLTTHAYACAESRNLWEAFEAASEIPVVETMRTWIDQPGYPAVTVRRTGETLHLTQRRFTCLPNDSDSTWMIPVSVRLFGEDGGQRTVSVRMTGPSAELEIGPGVAACKVNDRQTGFFRVRYEDDADLDALGERVASGDLDPVDRWGLQNDLYARVTAAQVSVRRYLAFLTHYRAERAYLPLMGISDNLRSAYGIFDGSNRDRIAAVGRTIFDAVLADIGVAPLPDESHPVAVLRDQLLWHAALYGSEPTLAVLRDRFADLTAGREIPADILRSVLQAGARAGDERTLSWFRRRLETADSEHERMNLLTAMGCFRHEGAIRKVREYVLSSVPDRNRFIPLSVLAGNIDAAPLMWDWFISRRETLEAMHPLLYERVVVSLIPGCGIHQPDAVRNFMTDYKETRPALKDAIRLALEILEIRLRMRAEAA